MTILNQVRDITKKSPKNFYSLKHVPLLQHPAQENSELDRAMEKSQCLLYTHTYIRLYMHIIYMVDLYTYMVCYAYMCVRVW